MELRPALPPVHDRIQHFPPLDTSSLTSDSSALLTSERSYVWSEPFDAVSWPEQKPLYTTLEHVPEF